MMVVVVVVNNCNCNNNNKHPKYLPQTLLENKDSVMSWNRGIITDKRRNHNKPNTTLINKEL